MTTSDVCDSVLAAVRRSDRAMAEQLSTWEALDFGVAHCSSQFPDLPEANQLRDVWLADIRAGEAFDRSEAYYADRRLTCRMWTPASGQAPAPIEALLLAKGWQRSEQAAFGLSDWALADGAPPASLRILPARAMPRAYRETFADDPNACTGAATERLNDSNLDAFVGVADGRPVGRISYLQVGDIARVADVFVRPASRGAGVGRAMMGHALRLARRLLPRLLVAAAPAQDAATVAFLHRCGFAEAGRTASFLRGDS